MNRTIIRIVSLVSLIIALLLLVYKLTAFASKNPLSNNRKEIMTVVEINGLTKESDLPDVKEATVRGIYEGSSINKSTLSIRIRNTEVKGAESVYLTCTFSLEEAQQFATIAANSELTIAGKLAVTQGKINFSDCRLLSVNLPVIDFKF